MSMRSFNYSFKYIFVTILLLIQISAAESIKIFDLRYTLDWDYSKEEIRSDVWDNCHSVAVLQGILNRDKPTLYLRYVDSRRKDINIDDYWLEKATADGGWLDDAEFEQVGDIEELFRMFKDRVNGLVVYDGNVAATSNVASSVAGADNLIPVRYDKSQGSLYSVLTDKIGFKVKVWLIKPNGDSLFDKQGLIPGTDRYTTGSAKCDAYIWLKEHYLKTGKLNPAFGAYYIDYFWTSKLANIPKNHHNLTNHDYFVSNKAWFFDLNVWADEAPNDDPAQIEGTDRRTLCELLLLCNQLLDEKEMIYVGGFPPWAHKYTKSAGCRHGDVSTEWEYAYILSGYNAYKDADAIGFGAMANASFWQHYKLKDKYPQKWVSHEELQDRGYLTKDGRVNFDGREFVIFYVGDYDAASWLYQRTADIWDDENRGKVPMMWSISPVLARRAPMAMEYLRETATANDYFVAADNGAGYLNPGALKYSKWNAEGRPVSGLKDGTELWQQHCEKYYDKWGLTITGFIIDGYANPMDSALYECYESFSPNGIVPAKAPISCLFGDMPVLRSDYDVNSSEPAQAAELVMERIAARSIPFHWFRNILKTPTWYVQVNDQIQKQSKGKVELLDAPTFFELLRIYMKNNTDAAEGRYPYFESMW